MCSEYVKVVPEKVRHKVLKKMEAIADSEGSLTSQDLDNLKDAAKTLWYLQEMAK